MNISMNIPETLDGIRNEDIPKLACYADKEANPLYPVPALWGPEKLEQMYHLVQEVSEHDRNRNQNILEKQHKFFQTGQTLPVNYRIEHLKN